MNVTTKWQGDQYKQKVGKGLSGNLDRAAIVYVSLVRRSFGDSGISGMISGATRSQRAANRSKPGEPPNVDTGHLKRNVGWTKYTKRKNTRKVGTGIGNKQSVGYASWLEYGTRKMAARPFLRPIMSRREWRAELTRPVG